MTTIDFTITKREKLRKAYDAAVADEKVEFEFEGNDFYTAYAKYLLEHLDNVLGPA